MAAEPDGVGARERDPMTSILGYGERRNTVNEAMEDAAAESSEKLDRMDGPVSSTEKLQGKVKEMEEEPTDSKKT